MSTTPLNIVALTALSLGADLACNVTLHQLLTALGFQRAHLASSSSEIVHQCQL